MPVDAVESVPSGGPGGFEAVPADVVESVPSGGPGANAAAQASRGTAAPAPAPNPARTPSRRAVLLGGGGFAVGAAFGTALGTPGTLLLGGDQSSPTAGPAFVGDRTEPWWGEHQPGVTTLPQGFLALTAFDLEPGVDRERLGRLMRIWTDDIARLAEGRPSLTDTEPELAANPARLTFTVGFGPGMFAKAGMEAERPAWLAQLPPYPQIDQLEDAWNEGDLVMQVCGEDPNVVTHAARQ
nr:hypothetical protein [Actinomycetales bacterium]